MPKITPLTSPMPNDWGYDGPAAYNPFFHPTGTAPNFGYVQGFFEWFNAVTVYNLTTGNIDHEVNAKQTASEEGAQEALRLVLMFVPGATLEAVRGIEGGIFYADKLTYFVVLPDGRRFNAAAIVDRYYHAGAGVSAESDNDLATELGVPLHVSPPQAEQPTPGPTDKDTAVAPGAEGPLAAPSGLSTSQRDLGPGSENYLPGSTWVSPTTGITWLREPTYWRRIV